MITTARLVLKHHRFELLAVSMAALLIAIAGLWFNSQLLAVGVPDGCFEKWIHAAGEPDATCSQAVQAFSLILYSNSAWFDPAIAVLPFAAGALSGVPLVGRELEGRTAQIAWSLSPSRVQWLLAQIWPVGLILLAFVGLAAGSASMLHETRINSFPPVLFEGLGFHGPLVVARGLLAFGLGLLTGALIGRTLPALIVTTVLCGLLVLFAAATARDSWLRGQPGELVEASGPPPALIFEQFYRAPDGDLIGEEEALSLVPPEEIDPDAWLSEAGYAAVSRGITASKAAEWEQIELAATSALGVAVVVASFAVVHRRRPT